MNSNSEILFLSDAHLNDIDLARQQRLIAFLKSQHNLKKLYILGDLFDFWFGYQSVIFRYFIPILCQMMQMQNQGVEIIYVLGNHDFYLGPLFTETIPMRIIKSEAIEKIGDKKTLLIHGDGIDKSDRGYRFLRFWVRSSFVRFIFTWIHPDIGWKLAKLLSHSSKQYTSWKKVDQKKAYVSFGVQKIVAGADIVIMGHTHLPFIRKVKMTEHEGLIINLGDWIDNFTYLKFSEETGFNLFRYDHQTGRSIVFEFDK